MIEIPRHPALPSELRIKILGLGGAGSNALDRLRIDGYEGAELVAINTDVQSLTSSVADRKVQLGNHTTRGLGAGGDPEVGFAAAEEGHEEIRDALQGATVVFLCVGLGGGTGSGAARIVTSMARDQQALVVVFATMPFTFEGRRRMAQAEEALAALQANADAVICFENDRMGDSVSPRAGIQEAFVAADQTISQSVRAVAALVQRRGLIHAGLDELSTALRQQNPRCLFGYGEAEGDNRAHAALEKALKSPLLDRGKLLDGAESVLVTVAGGASLTLNEVQILMEELNKHVGDTTRILFGAAVDPKLGNRLAVTILTSVNATEQAHAAPEAGPAPRISARAAAILEAPQRTYFTPLAPNTGSEEEPVLPAAAATLASPLTTNQQPALPGSGRPGTLSAAATAREIKQAQMQFEPVTRGRFEKSEPTIVDGQDLDVPTFLRRNLKVK